MKSCSLCKTTKPFSEFHRSKDNRDGLTYICKECAKAKTRQWAKANPCRQKANGRASYLATSDKYKQRAKLWALNNAEKRRAIRQKSANKRREANRLRRNVQSRFRYWKNVEKSRKYSLKCAKLFKERHPDIHRIRSRSSKHRKRALALGVNSGPVSFTKIVKRDGMKCHICRKLVALPYLQFDHVIPLSKGGEHLEENIVVTHAACNRSKSNKILTLF